MPFDMISNKFMLMVIDLVLKLWQKSLFLFSLRNYQRKMPPYWM